MHLAACSSSGTASSEGSPAETERPDAGAHDSAAGKPASDEPESPAAGAGSPAPASAGAGAAGKTSDVAADSGTAGTASAGTAGAAGDSAADSGASDTVEKFSFFVTSYAAMQRLSGSPDGFGGDLRYGEADGLSGADKICTEIAESSLAGSGSKGWRAFLSATKGPTGEPVHAADRIGEGPWYDRLGRLVAQTHSDLVTTRPTGADPTIVNDLPNEDGVPNHAPDGNEPVDNHDVLTGTNDRGQLFDTDWGFTCHDWTSKEGAAGTPRVGHSWPRMGGGRNGGGAPQAGSSGGRRPVAPAAGSGSTTGGPRGMDNWMSALNEAGCAAGASLIEMGPPDRNNPTVGSGGGYGAIYCFALKP